MKIVGYARASTDEQENALYSQKRLIREWAEENDHELVQFRENIVSGRTGIFSLTESEANPVAQVDFREREPLWEALMKVQVGEADAVVAKNPSRIARITHYQGVVEEVAELMGGELMYVESEETWIVRKILALFDEYEVRRTIQRTEDALQQREEEGRWNGRAPFGYWINDRGKLEADSGVWFEIQRAKDLYVEGEIGYDAVAEETGLSRSQVRNVVNRGEPPFDRKYLADGESF